MAKFRRNHSKSGSVFTGTFVRVVAFLLIIGIALVYFTQFFKNEVNFEFEGAEYEIPIAENPDERFYIPIAQDVELVHHTYYSLGYNENHEQAAWVAYELRKDQLDLPNVERIKWFGQDSLVSTKSAVHSDYTHSGYTRGHLAPAGDMAFNEIAMKESFFMSNMSPQKEKMNGGIWRELEENIRNWALKKKRLFIVTGPILNENLTQKIGHNKVSVPNYFYKIVLDVNGKVHNGIGFIIENERSELHLENYAVSIDSIEGLTGIDFFPDLLNDELEEIIESEINLKNWYFDPEKFKKRHSYWK